MVFVHPQDFQRRQRYFRKVEEAARHHAHGILGTIRALAWAIERAVDPASPWEIHRAPTDNEHMGLAVAVRIQGHRIFLSFAHEWFESGTNRQAILIRE